MIKILLTALVIITHTESLFGQDSLSLGLTDPDVQKRYEAITMVANKQMVEYVPYIEEAIFNQPEPFMIYKYLKALQSLNSQNIISFTNEFISLADDFNEMRPAEDPLEMKVKATIFLFDAEDYSTIQYVFDIVNRDKPDVNPDAIILLGRALNEVPAHSETAKNELQFIMNNSTNEKSRFNAMLFLSIFTESEYLSDYVNKFLADEDVTIRDQALSHLFNLEYVDLKELLLNQLPEDPSEIMRAQIADSILAVYGEPSDLKKVIDYQPNEPDPDISTWMQYAIVDFIPPKPEGLLYTDLATRLISYNDDMFEYEWILNEETKEYYAQKLNAVNVALVNNEIEEACAIINEQILPQSEQDLKDQLITTEGHKFLHYYTIYISEEIEEEFGPCP